MASRVIQSQGKVASVRKGDISQDLLNVLSAVGDELDVYFEVTSGGQKERGPFTKKGVDYTGSTRHDNGNAADTKAFTLNDDGSRHYLDFSNEADRAVWGRIAQLAVAGGAEGIGAGKDYMGNKTMHIGFGKAGTWGAGGKSVNAPEWLQTAFDLGTKTPPLNIPDVASEMDTGAPVPANLTRGLDQRRMAYAAETSSVPLPRRRPNPAAVAAAGVANTSSIVDAYPASVGVRPGEKMTAQQVAEIYKGMYPPAGSPTNRASDPLGVGDAGMSVTPRLPANFDPNNPGTYVTDEAEKRRLAASAVPMDQSGVQARATILDEGIGSLANPRSLSSATPNPKPFVSQVTGRPEVIPSNTAKTAAAPFVSEDRPTSNKPVAAAPVPATMSPALAAARQRLEAARVSKAAETAPVPLPRDARPKTASVAAPGTAEPETIVVGGKTISYPPGGLTKIGDTVYKIVPNGDGTGKVVKMSEINAQNGLAGIENLGDKSIAGDVANQIVGGGLKAGADQVATKAPVIAADLGNKASELAGNLGNTVGGLFGNLFGGKPATTVASPTAFVSEDHPKSNKPATTAKKPTAGASLSAPGAGLTAAQRNALTALPKTKPVMGEDSGAFWTGQGQAGKVAMPADVRPVLNRPLPATLAAPGAGLTAAQRNAMTSPNGVSLNPTVTKGAALMGAGAVGGVVGRPPVPASPITRTAAPALQPTVRVSQQVAQPTLYQSGGYLYSKSGDGYVKVGKVGSAGPVVTTSTKAKSSGGSSSSSSGGGGNDWYRSVTDPMYNGG